jgi:hypothetical protein
MYGSVFLELAVTVTIVLSNFTNNTASFAGAVAVKDSWFVDIHDCLFYGNVVDDSAGALHLEADDDATIMGCLFESNVAKTGSGSAVYLATKRWCDD